jgi:hypothetical protein
MSERNESEVTDFFLLSLAACVYIGRGKIRWGWWRRVGRRERGKSEGRD